MARNQSTTPFDLGTKCAKEGFFAGGNVTYNASPGAGTTSGLITAAAPACGQAMYVDAITFGASRTVNCRMQIQNTTAQQTTLGFTGYGEQSFVAAAGIPVIIPFKSVFWGGFYPTIRVDGEAGSTPLFANLGWSGYQIADDSNFDAAKTILMVGDSIQATGPSAGSFRDALAVWQMRDYLRSLGHDYRLVMKQVGGTVTSQAEAWRKYGHLDIPGNVALIFYQMGANDCSGAVSSGVYSANWALFVNWALLRWPTCKIVMFGVTPAENNTTETARVAYRSALSSYVNGLANSRVKFCDLGSSFNRTNTANYISSDPGGSHIHPSNAGNAAIYAVQKTFIDANASWF
jgi:hypothetical protein